MADGTKVNPRIARLLERIAQYPNIPRKRAKFEVSTDSTITNRLWVSLYLSEFCEEQRQCSRPSDTWRVVGHFQYCYKTSEKYPICFILQFHNCFLSLSLRQLR